MNLFQTGIFTLNSGQVSTFKIDCDALTKEDIYTIALQFTLLLPQFGVVKGIPRGGLRLADAMKSFITPGHKNWLFVDDVFTTGASMRNYREASMVPYADIIGAVIFARYKTPDWITPLFRMG